MPARAKPKVSLDGLRLVDHHCHGVVGGPLDRAAFEALLSEGFDPAPSGTTAFDAPLGLGVRRWCAPVLDLEPLSSPDDYLSRRAELGSEEVNRRFLAAAGVEALLVDSGYRADELLGIREMGEAAGAAAYEVVRIEAVAEAAIRSGLEARGYADAFEAALRGSAAGAVGFKTVVAYRGGFGFDPAPPAAGEVVAAAGRWLASPGRLEDPVLLRFGIWTAARVARERRMPLQVHTGFGDPDLTLHLANPSLLTDLLRALGRLPVDVVLLHCYPYHREAAYLAAVLPNVHLDLGPVLHHTGPGSARILAEAMELAPFAKLLYASDAFGLAELYLLGAMLFRRGLASVLGEWIAQDHCSLGEAERIAGLAASGNARRIYPLG